MSEDLDRHLVDCLRAVAENSDRAAFAELFQHFAPRLKAYMRRLGADDSQAEELMQEAMLMMWRRATSYDPTVAAVSTWLFTIARNKRIDGIRRTRRPEIDPNDPTLVHSPEQPDKLVDQIQLAARMRTSLAALPSEQSEVIRLAFYEGLSQSEIANRIHTPLGTVKSRIRLALQRLKSGYSDDDI
ncbi:MAG: sigma-70 family RNA polymerase sigma factor [Alphaproteobacteria bacterium]